MQGKSRNGPSVASSTLYGAIHEQAIIDQKAADVRTFVDTTQKMAYCLLQDLPVFGQLHVSLDLADIYVR